MKVLSGFIIGSAIALLTGLTVCDQLNNVYWDAGGNSGTSTVTFLAILSAVGGFTGTVVAK